MLKDIYSIATLFIIAQNLQYYKYLLTGEQVKNNVVYPHSGMPFGNLNNELLICAITWMNFNNIMLNETSNTQKLYTYDSIQVKYLVEK